MPLDYVTEYGSWISPLYTNLVQMTFRHILTDSGDGVATDYPLFLCREKKIHYAGERQRGDITAPKGNLTVWQIHQAELDDAGAKNGIPFGQLYPFVQDILIGPIAGTLNAQEPQNQWLIQKTTWQLFGVIWNCWCRRIGP
jgi:hypothetical protein